MVLHYKIFCEQRVVGIFIDICSFFLCILKLIFHIPEGIFIGQCKILTNYQNLQTQGISNLQLIEY